MTSAVVMADAVTAVAAVGIMMMKTMTREPEEVKAMVLQVAVHAEVLGL